MTMHQKFTCIECGNEFKGTIFRCGRCSEKDGKADNVLAIEKERDEYRAENARLKEESKDRDATIAGLRKTLNDLKEDFEQDPDGFMQDEIETIDEALARTPQDHRRRIEAEGIRAYANSFHEHTYVEFSDGLMVKIREMTMRFAQEHERGENPEDA